MIKMDVNPACRAQDRARVSEAVAAIGTREDSKPLAEIQQDFIAKRFSLPPSLALIVAQLHFVEARNA